MYANAHKKKRFSIKKGNNNESLLTLLNFKDSLLAWIGLFLISVVSFLYQRRVDVGIHLS